MTIARRFSNLLFAVSQAAVPALGYAGLFGQTIGSEVQSIKTPVVPADYAFSVWSVIFVLSIAYAIDQARPSRSQDPLYRSIGWLMAGAFAANTAWSIVAQLNLSLVLTGVIFLATAVLSLAAAWRTFAQPHSSRLAGLAVGTLAGWVTVAIFANWSVIVSDLGWGEAGGAQTQGLAFLSGAGLLAGATLIRTSGALAYALTIGWALIGLIVGNLERGAVLVAVGAAVWLSVLALTTFVARWREPSRAVVRVEPMGTQLGQAIAR
jgi:hypothetical protein